MVQEGNEIAARCSLLILLALALGVHYVVTSQYYIYIYVCMYICIYVYMYICIFVYIYIYIHDGVKYVGLCIKHMCICMCILYDYCI